MDIFSEGKSLNPSVDFKWVSFKAVGDKYQGVYIGTVKNNDGYGNPQTTYLIEQPDKSVLGVGMKDSKERFHELMDGVKIGQHVGFIFSKEVETGKPNKAKIIEIITNPSAVDTSWVGKKGINTTIADENEETIEPVFTKDNIFPDNAETGGSFLSVPDKIKKITEIATQKLGATGPEDIRIKVKEITGLDISPANLDGILGVLGVM
ncbi:MAG: hypothetical protein WCX46_03830 [Candidatus Paceibacterota bacterium]